MFILFSISEFIDYVFYASGCCFTEILFIHPYERGKCAGAEAVYRFKREVVISRGIAYFHLKLTFERICDIGPAPEMAGSTKTYMNRMFSPWLE